MGENKLGRELSPYLLQHRDNPIWWYPWGEEAIGAAQSQNKPIFLSIGYSTCYWCHVMAHESFEDSEVAAALNADFISIKLDREERPDLDMVYMDAAIAMSGRGGWPLSLFLTPDGRPFFGGTFFGKDQFLAILKKVSTGWTKEAHEIVASSQRVASYLEGQLQPLPPRELSTALSTRAWENIVSGFDPTWGGFGPAPKFPPSTVLRFMMRFDHGKAEGMINATLMGMARGGIFDHLEGGFSRYSVDEKWRVPHFEKMLYDNALLASTFLEAAAAYDSPFYREMAASTLSYLESRLGSPNGGFFSAEDAGEPGKEGEYYVWTRAELESGLTKAQIEALEKVYLIDGPPTFEKKAYVLAMKEDAVWFDRSTPSVKDALSALLQLRSARERPLRDEKIITGWNGMAIAAFARGGRVLRDPALIRRAERAAVFIRDNLWDGVELSRRAIGDSVGVRACLDDFVFLIDGLIELYQANGDERIVRWATTLMACQEKQFRDPHGFGYVFSSANDLIVQKHDELDHAVPASSAISVWNLIRLSALNQDPALFARAKEVVSVASPVIERVPLIGAMTLVADAWVKKGAQVAVIIGSQRLDDELRDYLNRTFAPYLVVAPASPGALGPACVSGKENKGGVPTLHLCVGQSCMPAVTTVEEAKKLYSGSAVPT